MVTTARDLLLRAACDLLREDGPRPLGIAGHVGDALLACEIARSGGDVDGDAHLARAIRAFNACAWEPSLHRGIAGLGLVLALYADAEGHLARIDRALLPHVAKLVPGSLQGGVAGIGLYASLRSHAASGRALQRAVIEAFAASARPRAGGVVWETPPEYVRARGIEVAGEPVVELGMVHGMAGALVALASLALQGDASAGELARAGVRAAWTYERSGPNRFGRMTFGRDGEHGTREFGDRRWCVGDPGILRGLWTTASAVGDGPSAERALAALREDAARDCEGEPPGESGRIDLCCGCGIVAHVYDRMHLETGEGVFRAARDRLLDVCEERIGQLSNASFAYGRAGVLLALLSSETGTATWDAVLGVSLPRATRRPSASSTVLLPPDEVHRADA